MPTENSLKLLRNVDSLSKNKDEDLVIKAQPQIAAISQEDYSVMEQLQKEVVHLGEESGELAVLPQLAHVFAGGMYSRIGELPTGSVVIGDIHKYEHFFVLLSGAIRLADGSKQEYLEAPAIRIAPAGTKRAIIVEKTAMIATFHANVAEQDKDNLVCHTAAEYQEWLRSKE